jgi:hypothetical protein
MPSSSLLWTEGMPRRSKCSLSKGMISCVRSRSLRRSRSVWGSSRRSRNTGSSSVVGTVSSFSKTTDLPLLSHIFSAPLLTSPSISSPLPPSFFLVLAVLRYSPYNTSIRQTISTGILGKIINIQHLEPVGRQHFAHSYVRGNWRNEKTASFSLMAKSCHDIDILK